MAACGHAAMITAHAMVDATEPILQGVHAVLPVQTPSAHCWVSQERPRLQPTPSYIPVSALTG